METAKDVEHKKLVALDWLRAATVLICRISLSVYVLQMTFGSFVIALFTSMGINYTIAFFMAVDITLLLSFAHYEIVEQKILRRIIH